MKITSQFVTYMNEVYFLDVSKDVIPVNTKQFKLALAYKAALTAAGNAFRIAVFDNDSGKRTGWDNYQFEINPIYRDNVEQIKGSVYLKSHRSIPAFVAAIGTAIMRAKDSSLYEVGECLQALYEKGKYNFSAGVKYEN